MFNVTQNTHPPQSWITGYWIFQVFSNQNQTFCRIFVSLPGSASPELTQSSWLSQTLVERLCHLSDYNFWSSRFWTIHFWKIHFWQIHLEEEKNIDWKILPPFWLQLLTKSNRFWKRYFWKIHLFDCNFWWSWITFEKCIFEKI